MKNRQGFTLIELLVAITVLAIVAVLGWRGLDTIVHARVTLNSELDRTRGLQLALAQMQSDCDHIVSPADIGGKRITLAAEPNRFTMVRSVFAENQPSRVQVVSYRVRDGVLLRRESTATRDLTELDTAWTAALSDADVSPAVTLSSTVTDMAVRTWTDKGPWSQPAPSGINTPTGLEVTLHLQNRASGLVKIFLLGTT